MRWRRRVIRQLPLSSPPASRQWNDRATSSDSEPRSDQLSYGCLGVHLADWPEVGNGQTAAAKARFEGAVPSLGLRSHVRFVSGAPYTPDRGCRERGGDSEGEGAQSSPFGWFPGIPRAPPERRAAAVYPRFSRTSAFGAPPDIS